MYVMEKYETCVFFLQLFKFPLGHPSNQAVFDPFSPEEKKYPIHCLLSFSREFCVVTFSVI